MNLHIVSFDVPFPPNYGGVIDVFYKIKALHKLGVKIHLHTFSYGRGEPKELKQFCEKISYYKRGAFLNIFSNKPYIVKTRKSTLLTQNLLKDDFPILFEGIHTTYPLTNTLFKNRIVLVRTHNIEHDYYVGLSKSEKNIFKKIFFNIEAKKLKFYEKIIQKVNYILTISPSEHNYFINKFGSKCNYIPVFHKEETVAQLSEKGDYALYHGDLRVADNMKATQYLIDIFKDVDYPLIIASSFVNKTVLEAVKKYKNIKFIALDYSKKKELDDLFQNAHINVLPTFQATGIKLKLIHALFSSRFCVVTPEMVNETGLETLCKIGKTKSDFKSKVTAYITAKYTAEEIRIKEEKLIPFNTLNSAQKIINLINNYNHEF